jgi:diaminohydroxyphosphoribosylaminopyrimidine deaminase/5-amino-6-(5-phosphoribosylamino)uracil reductase
MAPENLELPFFDEAILEMEKSTATPKVGAVLVVDGAIVASGHKKDGTHAERGAIEAARELGVDLRRAVLYTTLEPCVGPNRGDGRQCCADLIVSSGIKRVMIGRYDPHPNIYRQGWRRLRDANIQCGDFPKNLRDEIDAKNGKFMRYFTSGTGPSGGAKVDHKDGAKFRVQFSEDDERYMDIGWTVCGVDSAYGYAVKPVDVALARFATDFDEIDDPTAYDFGHSARIEVGEVGIFLGPEACVLVKVKEVQSGPTYGSKDHFVLFEFRVRVFR